MNPISTSSVPIRALKPLVIEALIVSTLASFSIIPAADLYMELSLVLRDILASTFGDIPFSFLLALISDIKSKTLA